MLSPEGYGRCTRSPCWWVITPRCGLIPALWVLLLRRAGLSTLLILILPVVPPATAEITTPPTTTSPTQTVSPTSKTDGLTRQQGNEILRELRAIRKLLERQAKPQKRRRTPTTASITLSDQPALGNADAPVVMVEFTDFQCPYCKRYHDSTFPLIKQKFIDTGKLRYLSLDLPLNFHAQARPAANAARCAAEQDRFWPMRRALFKNPRALDDKALLGYAEGLGLDMTVFSRCFQEKRYDKSIEKDIQIARKAGFTGTPSFVIGKNSPTGNIRGTALIGAKPLAVFEARIRKLLPAEPADG